VVSIFRYLIIIASVVAIFALPAQESPSSSPLAISLLCEEDSIESNHPFWVAVHIQLEKDWHVYWKKPGDTGLPLSIEWMLPTGFQSSPLLWPSPEKWEVGGITGLGYQEEAILLAQITPPQQIDKDKKNSIQAKIDWVACSSTSCQPGSTVVTLSLSADKNIFERARIKIPQNKEEAVGYLAEEDSLVSLLDTSEKQMQQGVISSKYAFDGGLGFALLFAFVGGLILNLMPCVLPVISLKLMSFANMAGQRRYLTMQHGILFSVGVICSFWLLASIMYGLQIYGKTVGWGFQLQEPWFVIILASILFVFSLNLFGLFEWGTSIASWAGQAQANAQKLPSRVGSFFSGILATVVATPCTGPFLGSAIGFAMTLPLADSLLIFTSLGMGMSFPYLLVTFFPSLFRFLPKPGRWMEIFKQLMGFMLLATVLWLLWVFSAQTNALALIYILVGFFFFGMGAWIYGVGCSPLCSRTKRYCNSVLVFFFVLFGCQSIGSALHYGKELPHLAQQESEGWENFSIERIAQLKREGVPFLIDFTAKWCLICQTNHLVLSSEEISKQLEQLGVVKIKADWTKNDPNITKELQKYGRNSVPLYVLHTGRQEEEPMILPQVLTHDIVREHLDKMDTEQVALLH